ncbi:MAG: succinate dehydrogenase, hydrophobic membrane anchor protein [Pseudomonadota bacterium]
MSSLQTPLHKVRGLGASHSGTGHFWRQRITAVALVPLGLWFTFAILGLIGTNEVAVLSFLARPWNALLMAAFATTMLYHMSLGLQDVVDDYVHTTGMKIFCLLLIRFAMIATTVTCIFALIRIAAST